MPFQLLFIRVCPEVWLINSPEIRTAIAILVATMTETKNKVCDTLTEPVNEGALITPFTGNLWPVTR